ncbi:hypothetical protein KKG31_07830 [Patescibacteria group bacterium]|nr:hypothetical protein [Patescibacteria group bacterium]MBU1758975.1 hypothetical protein [Patescibacteria group bacterium]
MRVKTTIGALESSIFSYIENIQLPPNSQIQKDNDNQIVSLRFATGTNTDDFIIHRDISEKYEFMLDNLDLRT